MESILKDERFAKIAKDKKFRTVAKKQRKVKIDKRFESMFEDERFLAKCGVDKRGRPKNYSSQENYAKYYDLKGSDEDSDSEDSDSEDAEEEADDCPPGPRGQNKSKKGGDESGDSSDNEDDSEEEIILPDNVKAKIRNDAVDYARGEGTLFSDSSSDESSSDEEEDGEGQAATEDKEEVFDKWGEMDGDAQRTDEATRRLAVCSMDWDRVTAEDIYLALSSFCPTSGHLKRVSKYLSEFGKERLAEEEKLGPTELRQKRQQEEKDMEDYLDLVKSGNQAKKAEMAAMERVRQYQVNRLKYYYAVAEFDSVNTANKVYEECDGMEYELSATRFDLRFIPDHMEFESPVSVTNQPPDPSKYQPKTFFTTALQQGKVELTWDENDPSREEKMRKAYDMVDQDDDNEDDLAFAKNLIACSSSEDEEDGDETRDRPEIGSGSEDENSETDEKDMIAKYRSLLAGIQGVEGEKNGGSNTGGEGDMEFSWVPKPDELGENPDKSDEDDNTAEELTPWEKYLKKKKDKKKKRKQKVTEVNSDDEQVPDDVDLDDPFFSQELEMSDDPSKETKKSKKKKKKAAKLEEAQDEENAEDKPTDLQLLVMDSDDETKHFNYKTVVEEQSKEGMKKKKNKWKKKKKEKENLAETAAVAADNFSVNVQDDRFSALFNRPEFNIDPSDPNFKKTKGMEQLIGEKQKRVRERTDAGNDSASADKSAKKSKLDPELSASLKSVKNKWKVNSKKKKNRA